MTVGKHPRLERVHPPAGRVVLAALLLIGCTGLGAAPVTDSSQLPDAALSTLRALFPGAEILAEVGAVGDLNGDGIPDVAVPIAPRKASTADTEQDPVRVVILIGQRNGGYRQFMTSPDFAVDGSALGLHIERQRLTIELIGERGAPTRMKSSYEFAVRSGELMLTGEVQASVKVYDHAEIPEMGSRFDYLAGRVTYWRTQNGRTARVVRRLPRIAPEPLRTFDVEEHYLKLYNLASRYIDDNGVLRSVR
ncbi:MAG: integrin alpha [Pseudomonadota bacterium]|nr:integrin alpha [Pseudomonadota bacterium]